MVAGKGICRTAEYVPLCYVKNVTVLFVFVIALFLFIFHVQRDLFAEGHRLFYARDWDAMVTTLEQSLLHFYEALDECKSLCDGPHKYDSTLEFPQVGDIKMKAIYVCLIPVDWMSCCM